MLDPPPSKKGARSSHTAPTAQCAQKGCASLTLGKYLGYLLAGRASFWVISRLWLDSLHLPIYPIIFLLPVFPYTFIPKELHDLFHY
jgi:hypothetical protein